MPALAEGCAVVKGVIQQAHQQPLPGQRQQKHPGVGAVQREGERMEQRDRRGIRPVTPEGVRRLQPGSQASTTLSSWRAPAPRAG